LREAQGEKKGGGVNPAQKGRGQELFPTSEIEKKKKNLSARFGIVDSNDGKKKKEKKKTGKERDGTRGGK